MPRTAQYIFQADTPRKERYRVQLISPRRDDAIWEIVKETCGNNTVGGYHCEQDGVIFQGFYPDVVKYAEENLKDCDVVATCYYTD